MVDNLSHIKVKLVVHYLQTNSHICIDEIFLITEFHFILSSCCIYFFIGNFRSYGMLIDNNLINWLKLTWKLVAIKDIFFNTREGLVNDCFQNSRLNCIVFHVTIIDFIAFFFFSDFLVCFNAFLVICFNVYNCSFATIVCSSFKNNLLLIF